MNKNITVSIDEKILRKAKFFALEEDCSLSKWVAKLIVKNTTQNKEYAKARTEALKIMEEGFSLGGKPLTRDEIYER